MTVNLPNEPGSWDADWSYAYLERLSAELRGRFRLGLLGDAGELVDDASTPTAFVRHDVDVSLERALGYAREEARWEVRSTYHVMLDSPFYDIRTSWASRALEEIRGLGNEVGLHYDVNARGMASADPAERERDIGAACDELERIVKAPVRSVSFHLPMPELLRGPLRVAGRVSGYAEPLFRWYLSDSRARWREGEPIASLAKPRSHVLQILVHPVWWGAANARPEHRLRELVAELSDGTKASYDALRDRMNAHIIYLAAEWHPALGPSGA